MLRKELSTNGLYSSLENYFKTIAEKRRETSIKYSLKDVLSSTLALFSFKYRSLNSFLKDAQDLIVGKNIKTLFNLESLPSDTQFRDILDPLEPEELRGAYDTVLKSLQRGNVLKDFTVLGGLYPISLDGTGYFSSSKTKCSSCLVKKITSKDKDKDDKLIYQHQMLGAAITHPDYSQVIPLFPEPIQNTDGESKNDCERNASKRWIKSFRKKHPKMSVLIIEDSLASNAPHMELLEKHNCRYLLGAKEGDHHYLYEQFKINSKNNCTESFDRVFYSGVKVNKKTTLSYEFINRLELNRSNTQLKTNLIVFSEKIEKMGKNPNEKGTLVTHRKFSWITDIKLHKANVEEIVRIARRRWAIENETFQTLKKTTSYNLEHNYGHGKKNLSTNFALMCMLSFLVDQVQEIVDKNFKEALLRIQIKSRMWEHMRSAIVWLELSSWEELFEELLSRFKENTS